MGHNETKLRFWDITKSGYVHYPSLCLNMSHSSPKYDWLNYSDYNVPNRRLVLTS